MTDCIKEGEVKKISFLCVGYVCGMEYSCTHIPHIWPKDVFPFFFFVLLRCFVGFLLLLLGFFVFFLFFF